MNIKKIITLLLIAFVVFFLLSNPTGASDIIKSALAGLGDAASALSQFVQNLV